MKAAEPGGKGLTVFIEHVFNTGRLSLGPTSSTRPASPSTTIPSFPRAAARSASVETASVDAGYQIGERREHQMAVHGANGKQRKGGERTTCWSRPDYQAIETSMEVTAYFVAKG